MDDVIYLCSTTKEQDETGVTHEVIHKRRVFCKVESVTRSEYYNAGRAGLNPEFQITMFAGDYEGEASEHALIPWLSCTDDVTVHALMTWLIRH